jgi:hypothetical protein
MSAGKDPAISSRVVCTRRISKSSNELNEAFYVLMRLDRADLPATHDDETMFWQQMKKEDVEEA